ncbi:MAG: DUF433 domain-containing protein [Lentisphaerae bacterium]|nr:DUF433 domain-containing protein [Lentisphaerota bacterium]
MNRITRNPAQCGGRPCVRGIRIRVKDVLDMLSGGATRDEILAGVAEKGRRIREPALLSQGPHRVRRHGSLLCPLPGKARPHL